MPLRGLHHAGLYVASLERSIAFYGRVFGLDVAERITFDGEDIAFLRLGAARLELIQASVDGQRTQAGVVDHVALEVDDLDGIVLTLREQRVRLLDPQPVAVPALHARILFCLGPDDERIELFERVRIS